VVVVVAGVLVVLCFSNLLLCLPADILWMLAGGVQVLTSPAAPRKTVATQQRLVQQRWVGVVEFSLVVVMTHRVRTVAVVGARGKQAGRSDNPFSPV
jgi:hypothetical protein